MKKFFIAIRRNNQCNWIVRTLIKGIYIFNSRVTKKLIEYWPVSGQIKIKLLTYRIIFFANADDALTSKLYYGVKWEYPVLKVFDLLANRAKVIFDVGGNIGLYALVAAKSNADSKIYCFEPNPQNANRLRKNISLNKKEPQIHVIEKGVGAINGEVPFYLPDRELISDVSSIYRAHTQSFSDFKIKRIPVDIITLDKFIADNLLAPDLIKIDVELSELEVLKGMEKLLTKHSPIIICEVFNDLIKIQENPELKEVLPLGYTVSIESYFKKSGYYFYLISDKGLLLIDNLRSNPDSTMYLFIKRRLKNIFYGINEISAFVNEIYS